MKRNIIMAGIVLVAAFLFVPGTLSAMGLEIGAGYWSQEPSGDVQYKPVSSSDMLDIEKDLDYEKKYRPFGRIKAELPLLLPNIYVFATPIKFEESGARNTNFIFGDTTFDANVPFDSMIRLDLYDVCLFYPIPALKTATLGKLNAEIGINARIVDFEAEVSGKEAVTGTSVTERESKTIPVPMVYAGIQLNPVDFLSIEAEAKGIAYSANHYYDIIGRLKVKPFGPIFIAGGYRMNDIKIDYNDIEASIKFKGPFVEAGVAF